MTKSKPVVIEPTPEETARIREGIAKDPDTWEASPEGPPLTDTKDRRKQRGRPPGTTKTPVSIKIDDDVLLALKTPDAKGWQTRANALLRKAVGLPDKSRTSR